MEKHSIPLIYPATKGIPYKGIWHTVINKSHPVKDFQQTISTNSYLLSVIRTQRCIYHYYKHPSKHMLAQASIISFRPRSDNFQWVPGVWGPSDWGGKHQGLPLEELIPEVGFLLGTGPQSITGYIPMFRH